MAAPGFAQETWQYDREGIDGPTASVANEDYTLGALCMDDVAYFFADFPRDGMPKDDEGTIRFKFTTDVPDNQSTFTVSVVTADWELVGEYASVWFQGETADRWIERMTSALSNAFIAVETNEETPRLIFEQWFSVRGSTAALRALVTECGQ